MPDLWRVMMHVAWIPHAGETSYNCIGIRTMHKLTNGMPVLRHVMLHVARIPHVGETSYYRTGIRTMHKLTFYAGETVAV